MNLYRRNLSGSVALNNVHARKWGSNSRNPIERMSPLVELNVSMVLQMVSIHVLSWDWIRTFYNNLCLDVFFSFFPRCSKRFIDYVREIDMLLVGCNQNTFDINSFRQRQRNVGFYEFLAKERKHAAKPIQLITSSCNRQNPI